MPVITIDPMRTVIWAQSSQLGADLKAVVNHFGSPERTTDGMGVCRAVSTTSFNRLQ
jgi:hypothetical protein